MPRQRIRHSRENLRSPGGLPGAFQAVPRGIGPVVVGHSPSPRDLSAHAKTSEPDGLISGRVAFGRCEVQLDLGADASPTRPLS